MNPTKNDFSKLNLAKVLISLFFGAETVMGMKRRDFQVKYLVSPYALKWNHSR